MIRWDRGGDAMVEACVADRVTLSSSAPAPPGSRIDGTLKSGRRVRVKVHACRLRGDGGFVVEGRILDAARTLREELTALGRPVRDDGGLTHASSEAAQRSDLVADTGGGSPAKRSSD